MELHIFLHHIGFILYALQYDHNVKSIPLFVTEIPVASPTATYTSYEEPSGEEHSTHSADFTTIKQHKTSLE